MVRNISNHEVFFRRPSKGSSQSSTKHNRAPARPSPNLQRPPPAPPRRADDTPIVILDEEDQDDSNPHMQYGNSDFDQDADGGNALGGDIRETFARLRRNSNIPQGADANRILAALEAAAAQEPALAEATVPDAPTTHDTASSFEPPLPTTTSQNPQEPRHSLPPVEEYIETEVEEVQEIPVDWMNMAPPPAPQPDLLDDSEAESIPHKRSAAPLDNFTLALGIWAQTANLTRVTYSTLLEVLRLLKDINRIKVLPDTLDTLKRLCRGQLPLLPLKLKHIKVEQEQQPSLPALEKSKPIKDTAKMVFFEPIELVRTMLSSESFRGKLHNGMAEVVDKPTEFYHSPCWGSSIRACSGDFAKYGDMKPIFPSDFVHFRHTSDDHPRLGQIASIGRDMRTAASVKGRIVILIQEIRDAAKLSNSCQELLRSHAIFPEKNELILLEDQMFSVYEENILSRQLGIYKDWTFDGSNLDSHLPGMYNNEFFVRRILNITAKSVRALNLSAPLRAELEVEAYGREQLEKSFGPGKKIISLPFTMFIDGFGLYRNSYRSLMGVYIIPAGLSTQERTKRSNVFVLTLGPHGSRFDDVIGALRGALSQLDRGLNLMINNEEVFVCAYTLAFIGDMPQQQANKGLLNQNANYGCGFCLVHKNQRANLNFDTLLRGRYHHQTMAIRRRGDRLAASAKKKFFQSTGMNEHQTPLLQFAPALDIIRSRPPDMAHSEFRGLGKMSQELLFTAILTPQAQLEYVREFQTFPFPPSWPRIQSPKRHLKVWSMSEAGRATIITPVILRCWLQERHIDSKYLAAAKRIFEPELRRDHLTVVEAIVCCYANLAQSNGLIGAPSNRIQVSVAMLRTREGLHKLCDAAVRTKASGARRRSGARTDRSPSVASSLGGRSPHDFGDNGSAFGERDDASESVLSGMTADQDGEDLLGTGASTKPSSFERLKQRPNMHVGLHYGDITDEYGNPRNCDTFIGEDRHRYFKGLATHTNAINVLETLLAQENMQQTIRFLLNKAFVQSDADITRQFLTIQTRCPNLLQTILPSTEQKYILEESYLSVVSGPEQLHASTSARIKPTYVRNAMELPLNTRVLDVVDIFVMCLRDAYAKDYGEECPSRFGASPLKWYMKVSFTDQTSRKRFTFRVGDFFYTRDSQLCRLDHLFVHELIPGKRRAFVMATQLRQHATDRDSVLDVPLLELEEGKITIGLPAIDARRTWVVPVERRDGQAGFSRAPAAAADIFLHCNWEIHFL